MKEEKVKKLGWAKVGALENICFGKFQKSKSGIPKVTQTPRIWTAYVLQISEVFSDFSGDLFWESYGILKMGLENRKPPKLLPPRLLMH